MSLAPSTLVPKSARPRVEWYSEIEWQINFFSFNTRTLIHASMCDIHVMCVAHPADRIMHNILIRNKNVCTQMSYAHVTGFISKHNFIRRMYSRKEKIWRYLARNIIVSSIMRCSERGCHNHYATFCIFLSLSLCETHAAKQDTETWCVRNRVERERAKQNGRWKIPKEWNNASSTDGKKSTRSTFMKLRWRVTTKLRPSIMQHNRGLLKMKCFSGLILANGVGLCAIFNSRVRHTIYIGHKKSNINSRRTSLCPAHLSWLCMLSNHSSLRWIEYPIEIS